MRLLFVYFLLLPALTRGQNKPLADAVEQARLKVRATNKAASLLTNLFTSNGIDKAAPTAQSPDKLIYKLTLNPTALAQIKQERRELLEISVPTANGPVELAVVPTNIFAPGFTVKTSAPDPNFTFDASKYQFYQGILKNNPNSVVALMLTDSEIVGMVSDSTGNRVLAHKRDKSASATDYAIYNEKAVTAETRLFSCGTVNDVVSTSPASGSSGGNVPIDKANSSCVKYVSIYFEADNSLYQYYNGSSSALTNDFMFLFSQVMALYKNDYIYVRLAELKIWNTADPYSNSTTSTQALNQFENYWNGIGNNFPGQLAHLLSHRRLGGGVAELNALGDRTISYGFSGSLYPDYATNYQTYSWEVMVVTHELGHNLGSNHTHWCGWPGGAIDNCYPTEPEPASAASCPRGPAPTNGGTIMSYCHLTSYGINLVNGFGLLPSQTIRSRIAGADLAYTTNDGGLQSVASGSWTTASTWVCGLTPSVIYDVTINGGNAVQLNASSTPKSLNVNGTLNLSTTSSVLNLNNN